MAKKESAPEPEVDEHGLVVHKYVSTVLVVVPARDYAETTLRYARSALFNVHVDTRSVSTEEQGLIQGALQDEFQVDGPLVGETMEPYSGVVFVGCERESAFLDHGDVQRLAREAAEADKLIGAWGNSIAILARAGVVKGRRITGHPDVADEVRRAGGKYTGHQLECDDRLVTCFDEAVGIRFGKSLAQVVGI